MPVISTASLKKGSQTVLGAYRGATPAYNARSFYRDFAQFKTLNHGVGPNITFTRGSQATYFDANGTLRFAPHNAARNSEAVGTINGVIWSPSAFVGAGVIPQWGSFRNFGSMEVVGSGTELGMRYVDVKISGTNTNPVDAGAQILAFNGFDLTVATSGQTWTSSASIRLVDGSLTNVLLVYLAMQGRQADTTSTEAGSTIFTPSSTYQRVVATKTMTNASTARVSPDLTVLAAPSSTINLTFRIAAPQLERNATASDYIPTTGTANFDQPRFDHDPATGASRGLLIEEARTNSIRNSQAGGSVVGTPGTAPTNWAFTGTANGVTQEVVGTGTENGLAYIDLKYSGTPTASGAVYPTPEQTNFISASSGQTWTFSAYVKLAAGSTANAVINVYSSGRASGGGQLEVSAAAITPTTASLTSQRVSVTRTLNNAGTNFVVGFLGIDYTINSPINITLRIAAPQLERGAFPTSYIPTTSAAVTRSADFAKIDGISSFFNAAEGSVYTEHTQLVAKTSGSVNKFPWVMNFGANAEYPVIGVYAQNQSTDTLLRQAAKIDTIGPVVQTEQGITLALTAGTIHKFIAGYATNNVATYRNGSAGGTDDTVDLSGITGMDRMGIGNLYRDTVADDYINGHIRKIAYYPKRLSNALLQSLTA